MVDVPHNIPSSDELLQRRIRSEKRRAKALEHMPVELLRAALESCPRPIVMYENTHHGAYYITYANAAAVAKLGYSYEDLLTFNNKDFETSAGKARLDDILMTSAQQGWDDLDLELSIKTEDGKILRIDPHLHLEHMGSKTFWTAYITNAEKVDPKSLKARAWSAFQRVFHRDRIYCKAPDYVTKEFVNEAIKSATDPQYNLVLDFKRTEKIDADVPGMLKNLLSGQSFKDHLFLVNVNEPLYRMLHREKIPEDNVRCYRPLPAHAPA